VVVLHLVDRDDPTSLVTISRNPATDTIEVLPFELGEPTRLHPEWRRVSEKLAPPIANAILHGEPTVLHDVHFRNSEDGRERRFVFRITPLGNDRAAVVIDDHSELYSAQAELVGRVYRDELTGLASRVALREATERAASGAVVAMLDLDLFKEVNDAFGHDCGDQLLMEVAHPTRCSSPDSAATSSASSCHPSWSTRSWSDHGSPRRSARRCSSPMVSPCTSWAAWVWP
jgi:hypothetical protein